MAKTQSIICILLPLHTHTLDTAHFYRSLEKQTDRLSIDLST